MQSFLVSPQTHMSAKSENCHKFLFDKSEAFSLSPAESRSQLLTNDYRFHRGNRNLRNSTKKKKKKKEKVHARMRC